MLDLDDATGIRLATATAGLGLGQLWDYHNIVVGQFINQLMEWVNAYPDRLLIHRNRQRAFAIGEGVFFQVN